MAALPAGATTKQIAQAACRKDNLADLQCADVLLLALTPASYSSNNTADTPGRRAFISPAQVRAAFGVRFWNVMRVVERQWSNNTADTPGRRALISPAQVGAWQGSNKAAC